MSYDHSFEANLISKPGVSQEQLALACKSFLEEIFDPEEVTEVVTNFAHSSDYHIEHVYGREISISPSEDGQSFLLDIATEGDIHENFVADVKELAKSLENLVFPSPMRLTDQDTTDLESAVTVVWVKGEGFEEIKKQCMLVQIADMLKADPLLLSDEQVEEVSSIIEKFSSANTQKDPK